MGCPAAHQHRSQHAGRLLQSDAGHVAVQGRFQGRRAPAPGIPPIYDNHCTKGSGPGTGIMMDVCPSEAETRAEMFQSAT